MLPGKKKTEEEADWFKSTGRFSLKVNKKTARCDLFSRLLAKNTIIHILIYNY